MSGAALSRRLLPLLSLAVLGVLCYDAWVFYSRWDRSRQVEHQRTEKEQAEARRTLDLIGHLKILDFYASQPIIKRGGRLTLCYSVVGAKKVRLEPAPAQELHPTYSFCLPVSPQKDTTYTLFAEDDAGHTVSRNLAIQVR